MKPVVPSLFVAFVVFAACGSTSNGEDSGATQDGSVFGPPIIPEHPVICDAPMCGGDSATFGLSVRAPSLELDPVSVQTIREGLASRIASRAPELILLAHWLLRTPTGSPEVDARLRELPASNDGARKIIGVLDAQFDGWRELAEIPWNSTLPNADPPGIERTWQGLETSGCGEMRLQMALGSVTVHQRDDNFVDDRVYCIVRATDGNGDMELSQTDVSPPLGPGATHYYSDGTFFGRGGPRDPGSSLMVEYDCWEMDDESEYEQFQEVLDLVMRASKLLPPGQFKAAIVFAAKVAGVLIELGKLFDGDDYLFRTKENFTRQDLWVLAATQPERSFTARGIHYGSAWSWEFSVLADACATGEDAEIGWEPGGDDPAPPPSPAETPPHCDGCWVGNSCKRGNTNDACGSGGADCMSCGSLESCRRGDCAFDTSRTVDVAAIEARVPDTDHSGGCWDRLGDCAPEVYMKVTVGGRSGSTNPVEGYSPRWNTLVRRDVAIADLLERLEVDLIDYDEAAGEEWMDGCYGSVSRDDIEAGGVVWGCGRAEVAIGFQ